MKRTTELAIGIDLSKDKLTVCFYDKVKDKSTFEEFKSDSGGIKGLLSRIQDVDSVAIETGNFANMLVAQIKSDTNAKVYLLNARKMRMITTSHSKTDKNDARMLAHFIATTPESQLPLVQVPNEQQEQL